MFHRLAFPLLFYLAPRVLPRAIRFLRLVWRLTFDRRVALPLRALVPLAVVYALLPLDPLDKFGLLGRFDDLIVLGLAALLLIKLAPKHVVSELSGASTNLDRPQEKDPSKVVDGSSHLIDDD